MQSRHCTLAHLIFLQIQNRSMLSKSHMLYVTIIIQTSKKIAASGKRPFDERNLTSSPVDGKPSMINPVDLKHKIDHCIIIHNYYWG